MTSMFRRKQAAVNPGPVDVWFLVKCGAALSAVAFVIWFLTGALA